jgi:hypothetical protein
MIFYNGAIYWVVPMKVVDELSPDKFFYQNADLCSGQLSRFDGAPVAAENVKFK